LACLFLYWELTSFDQIFAVFYEVLSYLLVAEEVLKTTQVQNPTIKVEERRHAEDEDEDGKINVEAVTYE
jgi:hypothetical protein